MYVIGTAGHVDHGKSALVQALTGIDPDRLLEEKARGLTIDLGFAWFQTLGGRLVSVVDVPGHERFIKNMLAGVGGFDLALLVIAADESVMPQTREHLAILNLLKVQRVVIVITKVDLVDNEVLELVQLEIDEVLKENPLQGAPCVAVSATSGSGLDKLHKCIDDQLSELQPRYDVGRPRLPIDRIFSVAGFGTVVTGTLIDGSLSVGQDVEFIPSRKTSRIRALQMHGSQVEKVGPGSRVAVNVIGLSPGDIDRGEVLSIPGWLRPASAVDARLHILDAAPNNVRHNLQVTFHSFSTEVPAKIRLLNDDQLSPGDEAWAQVVFSRPIPSVMGDRFVIRTADATIGGGVIVDANAARHRRRRENVLERLEDLITGSPIRQLVRALERGEPNTVDFLLAGVTFSKPELVAISEQGVASGALVSLGVEPINGATNLFTHDGWRRLLQEAELQLTSFHKEHPLKIGMVNEEFRSRLRLSGRITSQVVDKLVSGGHLVTRHGLIALPWHEVLVSNIDRIKMDKLLSFLERQWTEQPPVLDDNLLNVLIDEGVVLRAPGGVLFSTHVYGQLKERVVSHLVSNGNTTVAEVRDLLNTSRKYAMALLERMDDEHVTRRIGDQRVLLRH